jgi:NADH-quinone oxidoreductase subunit M
MSTFPWLTVTGAIPLAGAVVISLIPRTPAGAGAPEPGEATEPGAAAEPGGDWAPSGAAEPSRTPSRAPRLSQDTLVKWLALGFSLATLVVTIIMAVRFNTSGPDYQFTQTYQWIPAFGVHYAVGVDGIALVLIGLTAVLMPVVILASWNDADAGKRSVKTYFALMLVLETMTIGVFAATDVFLFYVLFEAMLIPMYFMIGSYGVGQRQYAAVKFLLYGLLGGLLMLVAVIALYVYSLRAGHGTFLFSSLIHLHLSSTVQKWLFLGFFIAFAIKAPLWPFHTWLPDAAASAQPGAAVILVGVLDKVGTFGMIRYCLELFPAASKYFTPLVLVLAVIGILYGAIVAIGQRDLKRLIAYTSVSHFGFIALGIFAMTSQGQSGATLYMVNHGFTTGALFLIVGFMIVRRKSPRIADYGGVQKVAPLLAGLFLVASLAGLSLPGLSTFVSEFLVLVGTFTRYKVAASFATAGIILAAIYLLWMYQRTMNGPVAESVKDMPDLKPRELWAVAPLIALIIGMGVYPRPVLDIINPAVHQTLTQIHETDPVPQYGGGSGGSSPRANTAAAGSSPATAARTSPSSRAEFSETAAAAANPAKGATSLLHIRRRPAVRADAAAAGAPAAAAAAVAQKGVAP